MSRGKTPRYSSLSERLQEIKNEGKRIVSAVILTYEFDSELLKLLVSTSLLNLDGAEDAECLRMEGQLPAVIFYHPKREQKGDLPSNVELHFWKGRKKYTCHHSKVYAFVFNDMSAELIVGSMNFTRSGLFTNREIFWDFKISKQNQAFSPIFIQWLNFIKKQLITRAPDSYTLNSYLHTLTEIVPSKLERSNFTALSSCLIDSGYQSDCNGLLNITKYVKNAPMGTPVHLVVVSPFFDKEKSKQQVINSFLTRFPGIKQLTIFSNNWPNTFWREWENLRVQRYYVPREIDQREFEFLNDHYGSKITLDNSTRELHAKLLILLDKDGNGVIYAGSANFSSNAWCGKNYELGVASYVSMGINSDREVLNFIESLLGVKCEKVHFSELKKFEAEDPEESTPTFCFPHNLESICLEGVSSEIGELHGQFVLNMLNRSLIEGDYSWEGIDLVFHRSSDYKRWESQYIDLKTINENLGMNRWVSWSIDGGSTTTAIPFNVDPSFSVPRGFSLSPKSENVLNYLTEIIKSGNKKTLLDGDQILSFSKAEIPKKDKEASFVDRDKNEVVFIQNWLRSLAELEMALFVEDEKLNPTAPYADLPMYFYCMVKEFSRSKKISVEGRCFCVGEIYLLAKKVFKTGKKQFHWVKRSAITKAWNNVFYEIRKIFESFAVEAESRTDFQVLKIYKQFVLRKDNDGTSYQ